MDLFSGIIQSGCMWTNIEQHELKVPDVNARIRGMVSRCMEGTWEHQRQKLSNRQIQHIIGFKLLPDRDTAIKISGQGWQKSRFFKTN